MRPSFSALLETFILLAVLAAGIYGSYLLGNQYLLYATFLVVGGIHFYMEWHQKTDEAQSFNAIDALIEEILESSILLIPGLSNGNGDHCCVMLPKKNWLQVRYMSREMKYDQHNHLAFKTGTGWSGIAYKDKEQTFCDKSKLVNPTGLSLTTDALKTLPPKLQWILSTPIFDAFDRYKVIAVFDLYSMTPLTFEEFRNSLIPQRAMRIASMISWVLTARGRLK